jgi:hypothetical protein
MRLAQSENKHLWYVYDIDDKIVFVSMFKSIRIDYLAPKKSF